MGSSGDLGCSLQRTEDTQGGDLLVIKWRTVYAPRRQVERRTHAEFAQFAASRTMVHSSRIAVTGFRRIARCAGKKHASKDIAPRSAMTAAMVAGSLAP